MKIGIYLIILSGVCGWSVAVTPVVSIIDPVATNGQFDAVANRNTHITCRVSQRAGKTVYFYHKPTKSNSSIEISRGLVTMNYRYVVDKPSARRSNWRLKIKGVRRSDAGVYKCRVYLSTQDMFIEKVVYMRVTEPPVIDPQSSSTSVTLTEGEPMHLTCVAQGQPTPVVQWSRTGGGLLPGGKMTSLGTELSVSRVSADDRGLYICNARNSAGSVSMRIAVDVNFSPIITPEKHTYSQAVGYDKELICYVESSPDTVDQSQLGWYRDSDRLDSSGRYLFTYILGALNKVTWKLYIKDIQSVDYGSYRCVVLSAQTQVSASISLEQSTRRTYDVGQVLSKAPSFYSTTILRICLPVILNRLSTSFL